MPQKYKDISGQRFGKLVAIERIGRAKTSHSSIWLCRCDCGNMTQALLSNLTKGCTHSCGCLRSINGREMTGSKNGKYKHGMTRGDGKRTRIYRIWSAMKRRCHKETYSGYKNYGGRGITVCPDWKNDFQSFLEWAQSHGYRDDLSIDRIDNDKGYSPDNCRWATSLEQNNNTRRNKKKTPLCEPGSNTEGRR